MKKLSTFILEDKFNLTLPEICEEGLAAGIRRGEMMRWDVITVSLVHSTDCRTHIEYTFDIYGEGDPDA